MFSYEEIYISQNADEFYRLTNMLENENIRFKTKITDMARSRMGRDILFGGDPFIINTAGMKSSSFTEYKIVVKKEQEHTAREVVERCMRERSY